MKKIPPERLVERYVDGSFTLSDLLMCLDLSNVAIVYDSLEHADRRQLLETVESAPHGKDWDTFRMARAGGWINMTAEEYEHMIRQEAVQFRSGVEAVREYLRHS